MKTSNFANNRIYDLRGISISRNPDKRGGFKGPEFPPLFPDEWLLNAYKAGDITWEDYEAYYHKQLDCLNCEAVYSRLCEIAYDIGADEPVLLCYESAKTLDEEPCHRRLVAAWSKREIGVFVPEWDKSMIFCDSGEDMSPNERRGWGLPKTYVTGRVEQAS